MVSPVGDVEQGRMPLHQTGLRRFGAEHEELRHAGKPRNRPLAGLSGFRLRRFQRVPERRGGAAANPIQWMSTTGKARRGKR